MTVIWSLARAGYAVIVGRSEKRVFTQYSRHTAEIWQHPDINESAGDFIAALVKLLAERKEIAFIFPIGETEITCLMRYINALPSPVGLVMADPATVGTCLDKSRMYEIGLQLGIPEAGFCKVFNDHELTSAAERIGYPCVVKPNNSLTPFFGRKALILRTPADLKKMMPVWPEGNDFLILQKFSPGDRHTGHFIADRGRLLAYFEHRVLRTDRLDGTGYGVDGVSCAPTAQLRDYSARLAAAVQYSGAGSTQFLVDDQSGAVSFLELNPRLDATCVLPLYCGYDFPQMAVQYAEHRRGLWPEPPANSSPYPVGEHVVTLWRDLYGWLRAVKADRVSLKESLVWLKEMARTFLRGDVHLTWRWRDPLPACYLFALFVPSTLKHIARKITPDPRA